MIIHLDMDYFYAQIEELRHPEHIGKILAVCIYSGKTPDSGVISSVNYAGRKVGIRAGMPIFLAKKKTTAMQTGVMPATAVFLAADMPYYQAVSEEIDSFLHSTFRKIIQRSIDEWNIMEDDILSKAMAKEVKQSIREKFGLKCSIGIAPSVIGAKIAASEGKPDGFVYWNAESEINKINGMKVEDIPGIGPRMAEALHVLDVKMVIDIRKISAITFVELFGRKTGAWLNDLANHRYSSDIGSEKEVGEISRIGTLKEETRDEATLLEKLAELEGSALEHLREQNRRFKTLTVFFITSDLQIHTKSKTFRNPKSWMEKTDTEKKELVSAFLDSNTDRSGTKMKDKKIKPSSKISSKIKTKILIRRIGIKFGGLVDMSGQTTLF